MSAKDLLTSAPTFKTMVWLLACLLSCLSQTSRAADPAQNWQAPPVIFKSNRIPTATDKDPIAWCCSAGRCRTCEEVGTLKPITIKSNQFLTLTVGKSTIHICCTGDICGQCSMQPIRQQDFNKIGKIWLQ